MPVIHIATPDGQRAVHNENEARERLASGTLPPNSLFWIPGMSEWRPIDELTETLAQPQPSAQSANPTAPAIEIPTGSPTTSGLAIASLVLGILSILGIALLFGPLLAIPAIICGHLALRKIKKANGTIGGRGLAVSGLFFGYISAVLLFVTIAVVFTSFMRPHPEAKRTVDASNLRQIGQASLIYANDNHEKLPPATITENGAERPTTIHDVTMMLALGGGLNDAQIWFSQSDDALSGKEQKIATVLNSPTSDPRGLHPDFAAQQVFSFDYAIGLTTDMPSTTPVAWTRGLRLDGTWDPEGVYGTDGGHIVFLGGNVAFYRDLGSGRETGRLVNANGERTSNILEALPSGARIVGGGPASLNGTVVP